MEHEVMFTKRYSNHPGDAHLRVVLAFKKSADNSCEFVVWTENTNDSAATGSAAYFDGNYFHTFTKALERFNSRGVESIIGVVEV